MHHHRRIHYRMHRHRRIHYRIHRHRFQASVRYIASMPPQVHSKARRCRA
jgi:hypothetical protein